MDVTSPSMSTMPTKLGVAMAGLGLRVFVVSGRGQTRRQNSHPQGSNRSMELNDAKGIRLYQDGPRPLLKVNPRLARERKDRSLVC